MLSFAGLELSYYQSGITKRQALHPKAQQK